MTFDLRTALWVLHDYRDQPGPLHDYGTRLARHIHELTAQNQAQQATIAILRDHHQPTRDLDTVTTTSAAALRTADLDQHTTPLTARETELRALAGTLTDELDTLTDELVTAVTLIHIRHGQPGGCYPGICQTCAYLNRLPRHIKTSVHARFTAPDPGEHQ